LFEVHEQEQLAGKWSTNGWQDGLDLGHD